MIDGAAGAYLGELAGVFVDPGKRVYWGYLASAALIALVWLGWRRKHGPCAVVARVFDRRAWLSRSAWSDCRMMALNQAIMGVVSPRLLGQAGVSMLVFEWMHGVAGGRAGPPVACPDWVVAAAFTGCLFVLDDFARYLVHRMLHRYAVLWAFHKVHHTATSLNPLTVYRTHPVEGVIYVLRAALVNGACIGVFVFFFGGQVSLATVLGASVLSVAFNALGANLRHSHVALGFWRPVERVIMSPAQHQVHHSLARRHRGRNFGVALSLWDWLFGTLAWSEPERELEFGVAGERGRDPHALGALYLRPFAEAGQALRDAWGTSGIAGRRRARPEGGPAPGGMGGTTAGSAWPGAASRAATHAP